MEWVENCFGVWDTESAIAHVQEMMPLITKCGFSAAVVGGVANRGWSDHDLDILLTALDEDNCDFEPIADKLHRDTAHYLRNGSLFEVFTYRDSIGRIVDLFFEGGH